MTILDKITLQQQDTTKIFLFKEGVFYKAYNEGVFLLKDKNYKVAIKHIKSIENEPLFIKLFRFKETSQPIRNLFEDTKSNLEFKDLKVNWN